LAGRSGANVGAWYVNRRIGWWRSITGPFVESSSDLPGMPAGSLQGSEVGELRKYRVDSGSAYVSKRLLRTCASLGVRLVHSKSG